jgi:hypothetical protein
MEGLHRPHRPQAAKIPCIFPRNREYRSGDGFADDCLHRQLSKISNDFNGKWPLIYSPIDEPKPAKKYAAQDLQLRKRGDGR